MAVDMFLKLDGVDGDSRDEGHQKWIEVLSFSWGLNQAESPGRGNGAAKGRVSVQDFSLVKHVDKASPVLMKAGCAGQHFKTATFAVQQSLPGAEGLNAVAGAAENNPSGDYLVIKMTDVLVSSLRPGADTSTDEGAMEAVSFNFSKIEFNYRAPSGDSVVGVGNFQKILIGL